jgi:hypothetical protein
MAMVMIKCVATGRQVFTGVETDPASVALIPPINAPLVCPACGDTHRWSMLDAELVTGDYQACNELPVEWRSQLARIGKS